jgi:hypothetical protein
LEALLQPLQNKIQDLVVVVVRQVALHLATSLAAMAALA